MLGAPVDARQFATTLDQVQPPTRGQNPQPERDDEDDVEDEEHDEEEENDENEGESTDGDDDRDFDFDNELDQKKACDRFDWRRAPPAQRDIPGNLATHGAAVRFAWSTNDEEEEGFGAPPKAKNAKAEPDAEPSPELQAEMERLRAAAAGAEALQVKGPRHFSGGKHQQDTEPFRHQTVCRAIGDSLLARLAVLRIDDFPGSGDPVFGTKHEQRRSFRAPDLFGELSAALSGSRASSLRKLTLQRGFVSAESLQLFLRTARPPLESLRCRGCLFHGRNFEPLVRAISGSIADVAKLEEFETDASIGGDDPFGLLADSFPNLKMLRAKRIFGRTDYKSALPRFTQLRRKLCKFPKPSHKLRGRPALDERGNVYWGITSDYHDDGYRGQGLWWDELDNTCECMEEWHVGRGVTKEQCLEFMDECGIDLDDELDDEECGLMEDDNCGRDDSEEETETIAAQLAVDMDPARGMVEVKASSLQGRLFAEVAMDPDKTPTRALFEQLAERYPCSPLALRLVLPSGRCLSAVETRSQVLSSVLE